MSQSAIFRFEPCSVHHLGFVYGYPIPKVQGAAGITLEVSEQRRRVGVTGDAHHEVDMIRHDRTRQELPAPVAGCLLELTTDHLGLSAGQPDRITGQLVLGDATEVRPAFVVGRPGSLFRRSGVSPSNFGLTKPRSSPGNQVPYVVQVKNQMRSIPFQSIRSPGVEREPPGERGASAPCLGGRRRGQGA